MIDHVCIIDHKGPGFYSQADSPVSIGTHQDAGLEVTTERTVLNPASLLIIGNRAYIDAEKSDVRILINHQVLTTRKEIQHDDLVEIEKSTFRCQRIGNILSISLDATPSTAQHAPLPFEAPSITPLLQRPPPAHVHRRRMILTLTASVLFGGLIVLLCYIVTAKTLFIEIEPSPDHMALRGQPWPLKIRGRYLVQPGNYSLVADKQGYRSLLQTITVGEPPFQTLTFAMEKKPGELILRTQPEKQVNITLNGQNMGVTPLAALTLEAGSYSLNARAERYQTYSTQLAIEGKGVEQTLTIRLLPDWRPVGIDSQPSGAQVWLNGEKKGTTPATLELVSGHYSLELLHPDYLPYTSTFTVDANQATKLPVAELSTRPGQLFITSSPSGASVFLAGEEQGVTPFGLALAPNIEHTVTLIKPGFKPNRQTVICRPGEQQNRSATLEAIAGTVVINTDPPDAGIFINGNHMGNGTAKLSLPSSRQHLKVHKSGYQVHEELIFPEQHTPKVLTIHLSRIRKAARSEGPEQIHTSEGHMLKRIIASTFPMGSPRREQGRRANETLHTVEFTRPFYLATFETSNQQFSAFKNTHRTGIYKGHDLSAGSLPVANVAWDEAAEYCNWLSQKDGLEPVYKKANGRWVSKDPIPDGYRLPTESEWEWVARMSRDNVAQRYAWGNHFPPRQVRDNYADQSAADVLAPVITDYNDGYAVASPVGSFSANDFGIFDMGGNVAEWCHDYHSTFLSAQAKVFKDPSGPSSAKTIDDSHVIRGASWMRSDLSRIRLGYRDRDRVRRMDVGFRIAKYAE